MALSQQTMLPIGIEIDGKRHKSVTVTTLTVADSYKALSHAKEGEYIGLLELAQMTTIDDLGRNPTYDELANASKLDGDAINNVKFELEKKEKAQATELA